MTVSAITPVGARIVKTGTVAYFPPDWAVYESSATSVNVSYGLVKNVDDTNPTVVTMELTYAVHPNAPPTGNPIEVFATIGGRQVDNVNLTIEIENKVGKITCCYLFVQQKKRTLVS